MRVVLFVLAATCGVGAQAVDDGWLSWPAARAEGIGKAAYVKGRVGGFFDMRVLKTERSYNYKLAATWLTPDVIRASARIRQLADRLTDEEARALVREGDVAGDTVVMVEIDPREGSGVIPNDWVAFLQAVSADGSVLGRPIRGTETPGLREVKALAGVLRRNYDYDRFWVVFPLHHEDGSPVMPAGATHGELIVRIHDKEGRVKWPVPQSLRDK